MKIVGTTLNNWNISNSISLGIAMHAWIFVSDRKSLNNSRKYIPKRLIINFWWFLLIVLTYRYRLRYFNHWRTFQRAWCFQKSPSLWRSEKNRSRKNCFINLTQSQGNWTFLWPNLSIVRKRTEFGDKFWWSGKRNWLYGCIFLVKGNWCERILHYLVYIFSNNCFQK